MASASILYQRTAEEIADAVRRLINDTDTEKVATPDAMMSELVISQFILVSHELGWDPVFVNRPDTAGPTAMQDYTFAVGAFQATQEGHSDIVAMGTVYNNQTSVPMRFISREDMEARYNNDIRASGAVQKGMPYLWSIRVDHTSSGAGSPAQQADEYKHRLLIYPAADRALTVYWPRTIVDTDAVDPSSTTARIPLTYLGTEVLKLRIAGVIVRALNDEKLQLLKLDRGFADKLDDLCERAKVLERSERHQHTAYGFVREYMV